MPLCQCGCGLPAPVAKQTATRYGWVKDQPRPFIQGHHMRRRPTTTTYPEVYNGGERAKVHRLRAERALGKPLPHGTEVHHVDGTMSANSQLVICQDRAYHKLLHVRMRVRLRGGNPNTDKICWACRTVMHQSMFARNRRTGDGLQNICRACMAQRDPRRHRLEVVLP